MHASRSSMTITLSSVTVHLCGCPSYLIVREFRDCWAQPKCPADRNSRKDQRIFFEPSERYYSAGQGRPRTMAHDKNVVLSIDSVSHVPIPLHFTHQPLHRSAAPTTPATAPAKTQHGTATLFGTLSASTSNPSPTSKWNSTWSA
jgi:hypothetical protein